MNNRYLVSTSDELSLKYNDYSVLEMMHSALAFEITRKHKVLDSFAPSDYLYIRRVVVDMILATDMSKHFHLISDFKEKHPQKNLDSFEYKLDVCKLAIKAADVGHAAKKWKIHEKWTFLLMKEFFRQGDLEREKGLELSMNCDRHAGGVSVGQAQFICKLVLPLYITINSCFESEAIKGSCIEEIKRNMTKWDNTNITFEMLQAKLEEPT